MIQISPLEILEENIFNCDKLVSYLEVAFFLDDDVAIETGYVQFVDYQNQYFDFISLCNRKFSIPFDDLISSKKRDFKNGTFIVH